jgi:3-hydroxyacyl-[acyl-carrier-protein] dehydratase
MRHYHFDRIVELQPAVKAVGIKAVSLAEDVFGDHFPGNPVLPGVYVLEGLAQTAGVLLERTTEGRRIALMVAVDRARFLSFARPGDLLHLEVQVDSLDDDAARIVGAARRGERRIATATFLFRLLAPDRLIAPPFQAFLESAYKVWHGEYPDLEHA